MAPGRTRDFVVAMGLSLLLHAGTAIIGTQVGLSDRSAHGQGWSALPGAEAAPIVLEFEPEPPAPLVVAAPEPEPKPAEPMPPEAPPARPTALGIDGGAKGVDTWIGVRPEEATAHEAMQATVDQPEFDPDAGSPAVSGDANPTPPQPSEPGAAAAEPAAPTASPPTLPTPQTPPALPSALPAAAPQPATPSEAPAQEPARLDGASKAGAEEERERLEAAPKAPEFVGPVVPEGFEIPFEDREGEHTVPTAPRPEVASHEDGKGAAEKAQEESRRADSLTSLVQSLFTFDPMRPIEAPLLAAERPADPTPPSATPMPPPSNAAGGTPGSASDATGTKPGQRSPKESQAFSKNKSVRIRPGLPVAGQGLEITTVRPEFTHVARLTAMADEPRIRLLFEKSGRVKRATILSSRGNPDIDEPLLNAMYLWTAKGEELDRLPAGSPGLEVYVQILLH